MLCYSIRGQNSLNSLMASSRVFRSVLRLKNLLTIKRQPLQKSTNLRLLHRQRKYNTLFLNTILTMFLTQIKLVCFRSLYLIAHLLHRLGLKGRRARIRLHLLLLCLLQERRNQSSVLASQRTYAVLRILIRSFYRLYINTIRQSG